MHDRIYLILYYDMVLIMVMKQNPSTSWNHEANCLRGICDEGCLHHTWDTNVEDGSIRYEKQKTLHLLWITIVEDGLI